MANTEAVASEFKRCTKCGVVKALGEFGKLAKQGGRQYRYLECCDCASGRERELLGMAARDVEERASALLRLAAQKDSANGKRAARHKLQMENRKTREEAREKAKRNRREARQTEVRALRKAREKVKGNRRKALTEVYLVKPDSDCKKEYGQWYRRVHADKMRQYARERYWRRQAASGSFTEAEWQDLCGRYGNLCLCCGATGALAADHVIPLSRGGSDDISNIQPLCKSCNSSKGIKSTDYRPKTLDKD